MKKPKNHLFSDNSALKESRQDKINNLNAESFDPFSESNSKRMKL
jgi:hypothetical protein